MMARALLRRRVVLRRRVRGQRRRRLRPKPNRRRAPNKRVPVRVRRRKGSKAPWKCRRHLTWKRMNERNDNEF